MLAAALLLAVSAQSQRLASPLALPISPFPSSIWYQPPVVGLDSPESRDFEAEAVRSAAQGKSMADVFADACRHRKNAGRAETANLFRGLIRWTRNGGTGKIQNRSDWPLHFIYGGYFSAANSFEVAETAAYSKEQRDAFTPGNFFDLDDYAMTLIGARWVSKGASCEALGSLSPLGFGGLPHRRLPSLGQLQTIRSFVDSAL